MSDETWKITLAAWGALTGTIGTTIGVLAWLRDRSRLGIRLIRLKGENADKVHAELKSLDSKTIVLVEVMNVGRRVRYIYRPEMWVTDDYLLSPAEPWRVFINGAWSREMTQWQTWKLEEGQSVTFAFGLGKKDKIARAYVPDGLGRKRYFTPWRDRWRWHYGRRRGGDWKGVRDILIERNPTRHHDDD